ncbi:hypothetical protein C8R44DRAFT_725040 [Mycena epipterygia]|nr:hypothetical protein C8R44DRAFT_725040 [Mycena epipterygia]
MSPPPRVEHLTSYGARFTQLRAGFQRAFSSLLDPCIPEIHFQDIECCWFEAEADVLLTFTSLHTLSMTCDLLQYDKIHEYTRLFPALRDSCIRRGLSVEHVLPLRNYTLPTSATHAARQLPLSLKSAHRRPQSVFNSLRCTVDPRLSITATAAALVTDTSFKPCLTNLLRILSKLRRHSSTQLFAGSWIPTSQASSRVRDSRIPILISGLPDAYNRKRCG